MSTLILKMWNLSTQVKNPQFLPNPYETWRKYSPHEVIIFPKFHTNWVKIVFFTWALRFQNRLSYKVTTLSQNFRHRNWNLQSTIALLSYTVKRLSCPRQQQQSGTNHDVAIFCAKTNEGQVQLRQSALHTISLMTHWWVNWDLENEFTGDH